MRVRMTQVDAFASRLFTGNPAAVVATGTALSDALMQAIAAENNLAETAFLVPAGADWTIRWFTPAQEVAFCGHATLASAHVLATERGLPGPFRFSTRRVGTLAVTVAGPGHYVMDLPLVAPEPLGLAGSAVQDFAPKAVRAFRNFENLFVELESAAAVRAFVPDLPRIAALGDQGLAVTGPGGVDGEGNPVDFTSRYFAPGAGIPEDPVTGSIHATLLPYWAERLGRQRLSAFQASARGGRLTGSVEGNRVSLEGAAVTYLTGEIELPG